VHDQRYHPTAAADDYVVPNGMGRRLSVNVSPGAAGRAAGVSQYAVPMDKQGRKRRAQEIETRSVSEDFLGPEGQAVPR